MLTMKDESQKGKTQGRDLYIIQNYIKKKSLSVFQVVFHSDQVYHFLTESPSMLHDFIQSRMY